MMAVVRPSSTSTSGRAKDGMKPCRNALYVSLISRCDSAAMVPNTSDDLPEPETPVNTVSRRLGNSTLTSFKLFDRAPRTRIRSWVSAACGLEAAMHGIMAPSARTCEGSQHIAQPSARAWARRCLPRYGSAKRYRPEKKRNASGGSGR